MRRRLLFTVLSSLLVTHAAFARAQDVGFDAVVKGKIQRPLGCPDGAYLCGDAVIFGLGLAQYRWFLNSFAPLSDSCGEYTATVSLTLEDSSLFMDEGGFACSPGNSVSSDPPISCGQPTDASGSWEVISGPGEFARMTGGGANTLKVTGADFRATYAGMLGRLSHRQLIE
jgi:hypothetical protein